MKLFFLTILFVGCQNTDSFSRTETHCGGLAITEYDDDVHPDTGDLALIAAMEAAAEAVR